MEIVRVVLRMWNHTSLLRRDYPLIIIKMIILNKNIMNRILLPSVHKWFAPFNLYIIHIRVLITGVSKWSLALMVGFPVVKPAYLGLSPRFGMGVCIYLDLFQDYPALFFP
jgi:hypothetical protein